MTKKIDKIKPTAKYITTHEELLKLHGKKVTCKIGSYFIKDARISVNTSSEEGIYICQNKSNNGVDAQNKFGYKFANFVSGKCTNYEDFGQAKEIQLVELPKAKIDTKEKFKNKYIDLSNKELNGEVTEEVFEELEKCFEKLGFKPNEQFDFMYTTGECSSKCFYITLDDEGHIFNTYDTHSDLIGKKEISIFDIKGMTKPTAEEEIRIVFRDSRGDAIGEMYRTGDTLELRMEPQDMTVILSDEHPKAIIKYQGKEKVITRESFNEEILFAKSHNTGGAMLDEEDVQRLDLEFILGLDEGKEGITIHKDIGSLIEDIDSRIGNEDLGFSKEKLKNFIPENPERIKHTGVHYGSRAWALLALDRGEKVSHKSFEKEEFLMISNVEKLLSIAKNMLVNEQGDYANNTWHKDGWELYKEEPLEITKAIDAELPYKEFMECIRKRYGREEPKKTMTIGEAIENNCKFNFTDKEFDFTKNSTQRFGVEDFLILYKNYDYEVITREE